MSELLSFFTKMVSSGMVAAVWHACWPGAIVLLAVGVWIPPACGNRDSSS